MTDDLLKSLGASMSALDEHFNGEKPKGLAEDNYDWRKHGLLLLQFEYGNIGTANYVSNGANREDIVKLLREMAGHLEDDLRVQQDEVMGRINDADIMGTVKGQIDKDGGVPKLDAITQKLTDQGKLIEAGWVGYKKMAYKPTTPQARLTEARVAFIAGAAHLFSSIMDIMDADREPTENDMRRMDQINNELTNFVEERFGKGSGRR